MARLTSTDLPTRRGPRRHVQSARREVVEHAGGVAERRIVGFPRGPDRPRPPARIAPPTVGRYQHPLHVALLHRGILDAPPLGFGL